MTPMADLTRRALLRWGPASRASPVDIVAAGPSAPRRLLEQLPSVTGPVEALARVEFCGQGVDLIAELG